jgi:hypothetical protein
LRCRPAGKTRGSQTHAGCRRASMDGLLRQLRSGQVPPRPSAAGHGGRPSTDRIVCASEPFDLPSAIHLPSASDLPSATRRGLGSPVCVAWEPCPVFSFQRAISPAAFAHRATARPASRGPSVETRFTNLDLTNSNSFECANQLGESTGEGQAAFFAVGGCVRVEVPGTPSLEAHSTARAPRPCSGQAGGAARTETCFWGDRGGERAAVIYSLNVAAKLDDVDPETCLREVLSRSADQPINRIEVLLPWNLAADQLAESTHAASSTAPRQHGPHPTRTLLPQLRFKGRWYPEAPALRQTRGQGCSRRRRDLRPRSH